ncbi:MAG: nucleotide pyrophosphohydrolase [Euryarchaeota archaeon]|jgi:dCTP diphosphatase|nr:nucleotide pyrophosphohydrolase [Euryarchaeota archaeon]
MTGEDTLASTIEIVDSFTKERDWEQFHSVKNLMASVAIEASELNETIQWSNPTAEEVLSNHKLTVKICDELADVMVYCLRLCSVLDVDPIQIVHTKIEKNRAKYPIEKAKGNSKKYTDYE